MTNKTPLQKILGLKIKKLGRSYKQAGKAESLLKLAAVFAAAGGFENLSVRNT